MRAKESTCSSGWVKENGEGAAIGVVSAFMKPKHNVAMSKLENILVEEQCWLNEKFIGRFNQKFDSSGGPDACWPWLRVTGNGGYGEMKYKRLPHRNITCRAHRMALILKLQRGITPGLMALHSCDNPVCVNPAHLREGTALDNRRDCLERGRADACPIQPGEKHPGAVLTRQQVDEMRAMYRKGKRGFGYKAISKLYPVPRSAVKKIILGERWK